MHDYLRKRGYTGPSPDRYKPESVCFFRRTPGARHQWVIREWDLRPLHPAAELSYEVEMTFETTDGVWVHNKFYSLTGPQLRKMLPRLERRLRASIEAMGGDPAHYRGSDKE